MIVRIAAALAIVVLVVMLPGLIWLSGNVSERWRPLVGALLVVAVGAPLLWFLRNRGRPGAPRDGVISGPRDTPPL
jgi:hypothetical protein